MDQNSVWGKLEVLTLWIYKFSILNILWLLFSLFGLIIFGIAPATTAAYGVIQTWMRQEQTKGTILSHFWQTYKETFIRANTLWLILLVIGFILYVDFYFIFRLDHAFAPVLLGIGGLVFMLYVMVIVFSFPLLVQLNLKTWATMKFALIYAFTSPVLTISIVVSFVAFHYLIFQVPVLYLFFSVSVMAYIIMAVVERNSSKLGLQ